MIRIPLNEKNEPATELLLLTEGAHVINDKHYELASGKVMSAAAHHDKCYMIDHNYESFMPDKPGFHRASGWYRLERRTDGIHAVDITWTDFGLDLLELSFPPGRTYRCEYHPYFFIGSILVVDEDTKEITEVKGLALTSKSAVRAS